MRCTIIHHRCNSWGPGLLGVHVAYSIVIVYICTCSWVNLHVLYKLLADLCVALHVSSSSTITVIVVSKQWKVFVVVFFSIKTLVWNFVWYTLWEKMTPSLSHLHRMDVKMLCKVALLSRIWLLIIVDQPNLIFFLSLTLNVILTVKKNWPLKSEK